MRPGPMSAIGNLFPRQSRLIKPADFKRVFKNAVVSSDNLFKVFACAGNSEKSRLGLAVSLKVNKHATVRNRIKRIIRESFRLNHQAGQEATETAERLRIRDYVVVAVPPSAKASNVQIRDSLMKHWLKVDQKLAKSLNQPIRR